MIEAWGRSFEKIQVECKKYKTPLPEFKISESGVMVLCKPSEDYLRLLRDNKFGDDTTKEKILIIMREIPEISAKGIAEMIKITPRGVEKNISEMKTAGLIKRVGPPKGGYWVVK